MKRHRFSFHVKTHAGQTAPADALKKAAAFENEVARRLDVEGIKTIYNADQTALFFELLPRTTITKTGSKTVWVKCGKKEKERMTAMVLGDSQGMKYPLFLVISTAPSKIVAVDAENKRVRHGFGRRLRTQIEPLQDDLGVQVHGNRNAWWNGALTVEFLRFHFGQRSVFSDPVMPDASPSPLLYHTAVSSPFVNLPLCQRKHRGSTIRQE
uniref:Uncharacterized protein AlNc14C112G6423 n=1 Tax=Albugo laibachii Nc14 TaxID=890382 RepID=F0WIM2_9STRA|nr:conserved hypothetical protein [Albugo laibachii Nc14]|eukprot:CCA21107.1 conserved hypothetical protein [Albugo laibachii Nc14]